jgi:hypothetical protein
MTDRITLFCKKTELKNINTDSICRFIAEEQSFESPTFKQESNRLVLDYFLNGEEQRRISIDFIHDKDLINEVVKETMKRSLNETILGFLSECNQMIDIEVAFTELKDEAWEMLTNLESFLANELDAIIYAPNDGFYDSNVKLILESN